MATDAYIKSLREQFDGADWEKIMNPKTAADYQKAVAYALSPINLIAFEQALQKASEEERIRIAIEIFSRHHQEAELLREKKLIATELSHEQNDLFFHLKNEQAAIRERLRVLMEKDPNSLSALIEKLDAENQKLQKEKAALEFLLQNVDQEQARIQKNWDTMHQAQTQKTIQTLQKNPKRYNAKNKTYQFGGNALTEETVREKIAYLTPPSPVTLIRYNPSLAENIPNAPDAPKERAQCICHANNVFLELKAFRFKSKKTSAEIDKMTKAARHKTSEEKNDFFANAISQFERDVESVVDVDILKTLNSEAMSLLESGVQKTAAVVVMVTEAIENSAGFIGEKIARIDHQLHHNNQDIALAQEALERKTGHKPSTSHPSP